MIRTSNAVLLIINILILFSCTADSNSSVVQENNSSQATSSSFIISIYAQENSIELWQFQSNKYVVKNSASLPSDLFLPLGIQEINSITENQITISLPSDKITSKLKPKFEFTPTFLDSIIPISDLNIEKSIQKNDYTLIVLPSKPDEYGYLKGCFSCPFSEQEMYLKSKLEWESIFGTFKEIPSENLSNAN